MIPPHLPHIRPNLQLPPPRPPHPQPPLDLLRPPPPRIRSTPLLRAMHPILRLPQQRRQVRSLIRHHRHAALHQVVQPRGVHVVVVFAVGGGFGVIFGVGAGDAVHEVEEDEAEGEDVRVGGEEVGDLRVVRGPGGEARELELFLGKWS